MKKKPSLSLEHQCLIRRYLLWAYKSTKESFERIERKSTQLIVDDFIYDHLSQQKCEIPTEFKDYISLKRKDELKLKFLEGDRTKTHPQYVYLKQRLSAIEEAVIYFLGARELKLMRDLYEGEFTRRILEARDH